MTAGCLGRRASKFTTRGKPPVMSLVLALSRESSQNRARVNVLAVFHHDVGASRRLKFLPPPLAPCTDERGSLIIEPG